MNKGKKLIDLADIELRAFVAAVVTPQSTDTELSLDELELLLKNLNIKTEGRVIQKRNTQDIRSFFGAGKAEEIKEFARNSSVNLLVIDDFLNPTQKSNLEKLTGLEVWDRAFVIMKVFENRANTYEAKLQVQLAQYQYEVPSLKGLGLQMSRTGGGIGTRGPGETEFERHRRKLDKRINAIEKKLDLVKKRRKLNRERKKKYSVPMVSLVGYTNSGKSTLLKTLSKDTTIESADQLFTTLDTVARRVNYNLSSDGFLLSDTVGFIRKLPTTLIAAFRATLEEVISADLLLVVLDASEQYAIEHFHIVLDTLKELEADTIPRIIVLNKIDIASDDIDFLEVELRAENEETVRLSALTGEGAETLLDKVKDKLEEKD